MKVILIVIILTPLLLTSQNDTLNKFDLKQKKDGFWTIFLDKYLNPADSQNAFFIAYELYDHGKKLHTYSKVSWRVKDSIVYNNPLPEKGQPVTLNGQFKWYDRKTKQITAEEQYKNGVVEFEKEFHYVKRRGSLIWSTKAIIDYTKTYNNIRGSSYIEQFTNPEVYYGKTYIRSWYYNKNGKWGSYRIND